MIEKDVRDFLRDDDDIRDRVGSRIFPGQIPRRAKGAAIVLQDISDDHFYHLTNESSARRSVVQVACYDQDQYDASTLFELVRNRLSGYRGALGDVTCYGAVIVGGLGASSEAPQDKSDKWTHRHQKDFAITHDTTVPTHV